MFNIRKKLRHGWNNTRVNYEKKLICGWTISLSVTVLALQTIWKKNIYIYIFFYKSHLFNILWFVCPDSVVNILSIYVGCYSNDMNINTTPGVFLTLRASVRVKRGRTTGSFVFAHVCLDILTRSWTHKAHKRTLSNRGILLSQAQNAQNYRIIAHMMNSAIRKESEHTQTLGVGDMTKILFHNMTNFISW